jgi:hypothetical protein
MEFLFTFFANIVAGRQSFCLYLYMFSLSTGIDNFDVVLIRLTCKIFSLSSLRYSICSLLWKSPYPVLWLKNAVFIALLLPESHLMHNAITMRRRGGMQFSKKIPNDERTPS